MVKKKVSRPTSHPKKDFTGTLSERSQHLLALSILFVLPVILFFSTILGDQQFMGHDTVQWRASAESIYEYRAEHDGEEPLWAENMFGGMPAYTIHVFKSVPHLDNMVFDQLRVIWPAVPYWVLLGGVYLFFILQGFRPLTAALGSIFISFATYIPIIIGAGHNSKFIAWSFIPWMLNGYWLMTRSEKRWLGFFLFAVACTLNFRAGHPQVTYYFVYLFAAFFIYDGWTWYKDGMIRGWGYITAMIGGALVLALLGTAEQYWRLLEYSPHSIRGGSAIADIAAGGGLSLEYAFSWSQGLAETLTLIIPNLYGGSSAMAYWGEKTITSGPHYFGAVAFLLFLIGVFRSSRKTRFLFLGVGLLTMTFSWGYHFPVNEIWFHILPGFDKFRTPEMWLIVTVFSFSVLSVYGLESCFELYKDGREGVKKLYLPIGIALGTGAVLLFGSGFLLPFESDVEREQISRQLAMQSNLSPDNPQVVQRVDQIIETRLKPERRDLARNDTVRYLLLAGAASILIIFYLQSTLGGGYLVLSLILLASFDMLSAGSRYISDQSMVPGHLELTEVIANQQSPVDSYLQEQVQSGQSYPYRVLPLDDNPFNNAIPAYFYPSIGGYSGAKLSVIQDVIDEGLFTGPAGINIPVLDMLNVRFISARRELPLQGYTQIHGQNDYIVYESDNVMPKAWFVDEVQQARSPREAFEMILPEQNFKPAELAVVETFSDIEVREDEEATVIIETYTSRNIVLDLQRSEPGFLVLSEIYYPPGWVASLNGEEIPIYKTNYLLRGFEIPPGNHTLQISFNPASHIAGSRISWAANITQWLVGAGLLMAWWRRRESGAEHEPSGGHET